MAVVIVFFSNWDNEFCFKATNFIEMAFRLSSQLIIPIICYTIKAHLQKNKQK